MFGRSGQMFPRRDYHDAMYEEEYGSESEEECCRGRGGTGVLCWFFSVILLIGLAASVILTVFFVLKSRNLMGSSNGSGGGLFDDLDLFYGFNQNKFDKNDTVILSPPPTVTSTTTTISPTEVTLHLPDSVQDQEEGDFTFSNESQFIQNVFPKRIITTTTNLPSTTPTRRRNLQPYTIPTHSTTTSTQLPSTSGTKKAPTTMSTTTTTTTTRSPEPYIVGEKDTIMATVNPPSNYPRRISNLGSEYPPNIQKLEESKHRERNEKWNPILPGYKNYSSSEESLSTTTHAHVLFSMPPSTNQNTPNVNNRRRPNRGPPLTSFSTSTERRNAETPVSPRTTPPTSTSPAPILSPSPAVSNSSTLLPNRGNILERIIKNLAPKFKNRTEIFSSNERFVPANPNLRIKTTIRTRTTSPDTINFSNEQIPDTGKAGGEVFEVIDPPKLSSTPSSSPKPEKNESNTGFSPNSDFMDLIVGDADQKRLITKETASGVITSAILPSWYVNETETNSAENATKTAEPTSTNVPTVTQMPTIVPSRPTHGFTRPTPGPTRAASLPFRPTPGPIREPPRPSQSGPPNSHSSNEDWVNPGLGQFLLNMFKASTQSHSNEKEPNRVGSLTGHSGPPIRNAEENRPPTTPSSISIRPTTFKDRLREQSTLLTSSSLSPLQDENAFHGYGNGHLYGHDPEEDDRSEEGQVSDDELESQEDEEVPAPSHVIEVSFDRKERPEIIIDADGDSAQEEGINYSKPLNQHSDREPLKSGSEIHPQIIPPPRSFTTEFNTEQLSNPLKMATDVSNFTSQTIPQGQADEPKILQGVRPPPGPKNPSSVDVNQNIKNILTQVPGNKPVRLRPALENSEHEDEEESAHDDQKDSGSENVETVQEFDQLHNTFGQKLNSEQNADSNRFIQRQPVNQLDENLYHQAPYHPVSSQAQQSFQKQKPTSAQESSSERRKVFQIQGWMGSTTKSAFQEVPAPNSYFPSNTSTFNPPDLIDFHSNVYNFQPSVANIDGGFKPLAAETWRPLVYEDEKNNPKHPPPHTHQAHSHQAQAHSHQVHSYNQFIPQRVPVPPNRYTSVEQQKLIGSILPTFAEALKLRPTTTGSQFDQSAEGSAVAPHWSNALTNQRTTKSPRLMISSQPIPSPPLQHQQQQSGMIKFPTEADQDFQQGGMIDRTKYLRRPVPPPILMRRNPQPQMRPDNRQKVFRNPPYLNQQQQIQQQRLLRERLYHQQMTRQRQQQGHVHGHGGGNIQWPTEHQPARSG